MAKLIIELPDSPATTFELEAETITIGRLPESTIQIEDPSVSSNHAEIIFSGGNHTLTDLGSTNGTRHNGSPVTSVILRDGDTIRFGKISATFQSKEAGDVIPLPETSELEAVVADTSSKPTGFSNASPFQRQAQKQKDLSAVFFGAAALGIIALGVALLQVYSLQPPQ